MLRISQVKHIYPSPGVRGAVQPAASETWNPTSRQPRTSLTTATHYTKILLLSSSSTELADGKMKIMIMSPKNDAIAHHNLP